MKPVNDKALAKWKAELGTGRELAVIKLERLAIKRALERVQHARELCIQTWIKCDLGDIGTQQEHPLAQARSACGEAEQWLEATLNESK